MNFLPRVTALFLRVAQPLMRSLVTLPALHLFWSHSTLGTNGGNGNATLAPSANQTLEIGGTDTDTTAVVTSGGPALSISSTIFTDTGLTTTITSGGQTKDNTLTLTGTVSSQ